MCLGLYRNWQMGTIGLETIFVSNVIDQIFYIVWASPAVCALNNNNWSLSTGYLTKCSSLGECNAITLFKTMSSNSYERKNRNFYQISHLHTAQTIYVIQFAQL